MAERVRQGVLAALCVAVISPLCADPGHPLLHALGTPAPAALIERWDIAIGPDGAELPAGRGSVEDGRALFSEHCAACHGTSGREGPDPVLVGGRGTLAGDQPLLTVGSYWPYATTLYDYIYRAMPFFAPASLSANEVYALSAFVLHANDIVGADAVMDRRTLPAVVMPNRNGFIADPRPDVTPPSAARAD